MPTVARLIVDQLVACAADRAVGAPGESFLAAVLQPTTETETETEPASLGHLVTG